MKEARFPIPADVRLLLMDPTEEYVTFHYADPIHALVNMLHFNTLSADPDNMCFVYEEQPFLDDFCNGDRVRRIQASPYPYRLPVL